MYLRINTFEVLTAVLAQFEVFSDVTFCHCVSPAWEFGRS